MAVTKKQIQSKAERDKINLAMRATPEWRNAIKGMGLDPDGPLKLSKAQQQQLASVFGVPQNAGHIDAAGNISDFHGWKGLPTAAKIAIVAGAAVGTAGAAGAFSGGGAAASAAGGGGAATTAGGTAAAVLPSTSLSTAALMGGPAALASEGASVGIPLASGSGAGMNIFSKLLGFVKKNPLDILQAGGRMLTSNAQASADNRGTELEANLEIEKLKQQAQKDYMDQLLARSKDDREGEGDAWKKLQTSGYVSNWKQPATNSFSPYSRPLVAPSDDVKAGATALMGQKRDALMSGQYNTNGGAPLPMPKPFEPTIDPKLMKGSAWERLQGYLGAGADLAGNARGISRKA